MAYRALSLVLCVLELMSAVQRFIMIVPDIENCRSPKFEIIYLVNEFEFQQFASRFMSSRLISIIIFINDRNLAQFFQLCYLSFPVIETSENVFLVI